MVSIKTYSANTKLKARCTSPAKKFPSHLYIRGENFYYRHRIPKKWISRCEVTEIRFSLETDSLKEAKYKAALITSALWALFKEKDMVSSKDLADMKPFIEEMSRRFNLPKSEACPPPMAADILAWLNQHGYDYTLDEVSTALLKQYTKHSQLEFSPLKLNAILNGENKIKLSRSDISKRLIGYHRYLLDLDSEDIVCRTLYENRKLQEPLLDMETPKQIGVTKKNVYSFILKIHEDLVDNPPLLCLYTQDFLEHLIEVKLFQPEELSHENHLIITNEHCKITIDYMAILQARLNKDYSKEKLFFTLPFEEYPRLIQQKSKTVARSNPRKSRTQKPRLSSFIGNYLDTKVKDGKKDLRYIPELKKKLELFINIMGDKPIDEYERTDFRNFRDNLQKLPPNLARDKQLKDKPISEVIAMEHLKTLSEKTISSYMNDVSALFKWLVIEGFLTTNHATGLGLKKKHAEIDERGTFSLEEIHTIFNSKELQAQKNSPTPSRYWAPWIGLYTGMRREEICQLHCDDIYQVNGLWVIDVNDKKKEHEDNSKNLKSTSAHRIIPIHDHLKELGLLSYLKNIKQNHERLFPDLKASSNRGEYGKMVGKDFGLLVKKLNIESGKSFHSLRHAFSSFFKKKLLHNEIFEQIFGHAHGKLATRRYGDRFTPQECYEQIIKLLDYGLGEKILK